MNKELLEIKPLVDLKVIVETLTRLGIANKEKKIIYPSCYLIEKDNRIFLAHFKQCFLLEGNNSYNNISLDDIHRRNAIAFCLKNWKLIDVDNSLIEPHTRFIFVLPHKDKHNWQVINKWTAQRNKI